MNFLKTKIETAKDRELTDKELVGAIIAENNLKIKRKLQETLYNRHAEKIYFKCLNIVKSKDTAKDLTHDIIIKIFFNLSKYSGKSDFHFWVAAVAYNHCISWLNKEKKLKVEDIDAYPNQMGADDDGEAIALKMLEELQLSQIERLFTKLKETERIVLLMRYQDGLSVKSIASMLNVGESAVKMRLKRGRDHLIALVNEEENA